MAFVPVRMSAAVTGRIRLRRRASCASGSGIFSAISCAWWRMARFISLCVSGLPVSYVGQ